MSFSIPLKFTLGSKVFNGLPDNCTASETRTENKTVTSYTGTAGALTVTAELTQYSDFDACEWVVYFKNNTDGESEILSDVLAVSMDFDFSDAKLYTCNGDFYSYDGYETTEHDIHANSGFVFEQAPVGGRACDRAFPYQRLVSGAGGFNVAVGWPGQWFCRWEENSGKIHLDAGQQRVHTVLHPGETFRTPLIALVGFEGGLERGINVWRRWYRKYVLPKNAEPILHGVDNAGGQEFCSATQEQQLESLKGFIQNGTGINMWWIDAGWYPAITPEGEENWWKTTGTWECDKKRFPNGFRPISDYCAQHSVKLMIWFEVERANEGTKLFAEHPEWLVKNTDEPVRYGFMLDMGNEACVDYLSKYIADFLIENNISIYRQDYNFEPLPYWQHNETPDRVGMNENRCICGYLRYWDYLLEHVPGLLIDSCASGGRRNDLETVRRAIVLHQTDAAYGNHPVKHAFF